MPPLRPAAGNAAPLLHWVPLLSASLTRHLILAAHDLLTTIQRGLTLQLVVVVHRETEHPEVATQRACLRDSPHALDDLEAP
jgi:hypothetical protein